MKGVLIQNLMKNLTIAFWVVFLAIALLFLLGGCSIVGPGERGIRVSFGTTGTESLPQGLYLWVPVAYGLKRMDVRIQKSEVDTAAASKDMQDVTTKFALNWHLDPAKVVKVYTDIGSEYDVLQNVISPAISEILKSSTAKKTAEEVLTKRHELKEEIDAEIKTRMLKYGIIIDDINIVNVSFSKDFAHAIEQKQIAEQRAKQAEYEAIKAKQDAVAEVNRAQGQSEAQKLLRVTLSPELLQLKAIEKWSGAVPQFMGSGSNMLFNIPINSK